MNKNIFYLIGGVIILAIVIVIILMPTDKTESNGCDLDSECLFNSVGEGPCEPCSYSDEGYVCMTLEEIIEFKKQNPKNNTSVLGSPCLEPDYDSHECRCINNKCEKKLK